MSIFEIKKVHTVIIISILFLFFVVTPPAFAQTLKEAHKLTDTGMSLMNRGHYREALEAYKKALVIYQKEKHARGIGASNLNIGNALRRMRDYKGALEHYKKAAEIFDKSGDGELQAILLGNIGNVYLDINKFDEAVKYYQQAVDIARQIKNPKVEGINLGNIGSIYLNLNNYKKAIKYYNEAIPILEKAGIKGTVGTFKGHLAIIYSNTGEYKKAVSLYKEAIKIVEETENYPDQSLFYGKLSKLSLQTGDFKNAKLFCQKAIDIAKKIDHKLYISKWTAELALIYARLGDRDKTGELIKESLAVAKSMNHPKTEADVYSIYGLCCEQWGDLDAALKNYQAAFGMYEKINSLDGMEYALEKAGGVHRKLGNFGKSLKFYTGAIELDKKMGNPDKMSLNLGSIGLVLMEAGRYKEAVEFFKKSYAIATEVNNIQAQLACVLNLANAYASLGDHEKATKAFDIVLNNARVIENRDLEASAFENMGFVNFKTGNNERALQFFSKCLKLMRQTGDQKGVASSYMNIGSVYFNNGKYKKAYDYYNKAFILASEIGDNNIKGICWMNLAAIYTQTRQFEKAIELNKEIMGEKKKRGDVGSYNLALMNTGITYYKKGIREKNSDDFQQGIKYLDEALDSSLKSGDLNTTAQIYGHLGILYAHLKENDKAISYLKKAVSIIEGFREDLRIEDMQAGLTEKYFSFYDILIGLLIEKGKSEEALEYAERAKARNFLNSLGNLDIIPREEGTIKAVEQKREMLSEIRALHKTLPGLKGKAAVGARIKIKKIREKVDELENLIKRISPEFSSLVTINPSNLKEIQNSLKPGEAILEYFMEDNVYVWIITRDKLTCKTFRFNKKKANKLVEALKENLVPAIGKQRGEKERKLCREYLAGFYNLIIQPVEKDLKGVKQLIIVPHGSLHYIPFAALIDNKGKFLVENYSILIEPSASSLVLLRKRKEKRPPVMTGFALGNVSLRREKKASSGSGIIPQQLRAGFSPLPGTREEILEIDKTLKKGNFKTKIFLEKEFNLESVENAIKNSGIIHFATHGFLSNRGKGNFSGLVTSDGFIYIMDIYNWRLNSDMVVLSACQTAKGKMLGGDDMVGLSRAFMQAGADNLLATLWKVQDKTTRDLMIDFYNNLLSGQSKPQALRNAQVKLIEKDPDPYLWAPFILTGKG